jgi:hypothetical protein
MKAHRLRSGDRVELFGCQRKLILLLKIRIAVIKNADRRYHFCAPSLPKLRSSVTIFVDRAAVFVTLGLMETGHKKSVARIERYDLINTNEIACMERYNAQNPKKQKGPVAEATEPILAGGLPVLQKPAGYQPVIHFKSWV